MMGPAAGDRAIKKSVNFAEPLAEALLSTRSDAIVATDRDGDETKQFQETRALKQALSSHQPLPADVLERPATRK